MLKHIARTIAKYLHKYILFDTHNVQWTGLSANPHPDAV